MNALWLLGVALGTGHVDALRVESLGDFPPLNRVLIYQYGKVASTSLQQSIGKLLKPPAKIPYVWTGQKHYGPYAKTHSPGVARAFLDAMPDDSSAWVVTATRSPFQRKVSDFFQNLHRRFHSLADAKRQAANMTMAELHELYRPKWCNEGTWFADSFNPVVGFDILSSAEHIRAGGRVVRHNSTKGRDLAVLVLRFEDIKRWHAQLRGVLPGFVIARTNTGEQKWYASLYKQFLETYVLSEMEVQCYCKCETFAFYTRQEVCAIAPVCCQPQAAGAARGAGAPSAAAGAAVPNATEDAAPAPDVEMMRGVQLREDDSDSGRGYVTTATGEKLLVYDVTEDGYDDGGDAGEEACPEGAVDC
eukprot:CAMPEP_0171198966 /NCGR_PEP_ID=MMETSP0790-20130122/23220_1 /TAXON_ID=2925 /ORGANISM="Alexandrium catenella, Strain OF101" /LENGTH=360 /DNA_ID=CAMNT_0011664297 /DNA_START=27 /DNA_END=1109 /DNA_ORIENTATION=-